MSTRILQLVDLPTVNRLLRTACYCSCVFRVQESKTNNYYMTLMKIQVLWDMTPYFL